MTDRQISLLYFLTVNPDWTKVKDVLEELRGVYPSEDPGNRNTRARRNLTSDIRALNESPEFAGIIIHGTRGIKIATKEEADIYLKSRAFECLRAWKLLHAQARKIGLDMQIDLNGKENRAYAPSV